VRKGDSLPPSNTVVTKSGNLNFLEPSGPVQACNGTALPLPLMLLLVLLHQDCPSCGPSDCVMWSPATFASYMYDILLNTILFFLAEQQPLVGRASSLSRLHDYIQTHHTRWDSSGRVISSAHRPLPYYTQHSHPYSR